MNTKKDMNMNESAITEKSGAEVTRMTKEERSAWLDEQQRQAEQWVKNFNFPSEYRPGEQLIDIYRTVNHADGMVVVQRRDLTEGDLKWNDIASFDRGRRRAENWPVPFRPFRQLREGEWKHFALIAPESRGFIIIDLSDGSVVAKPEGYHDMVGGFWTHDFRPSYPEHDMSLAACLAEDDSSWEEYVNDPNAYHSHEDVWELEPLDAKFALVSGVMPGYGEPFYVRFIDLTTLKEGTITIDSRFGKHGDLPEGVDIMDAVSFSFRRLTLTVPHLFDLDGTLVWPK